MERTDRLSRRRVLQFTGVAATTTLIAGCSDEGPGNESGNGTGEDDPAGEDTTEEDGAENETEEGAAENETEEGAAENESEEDSAGNESEEGAAGDVDTAEWEDVDQIELLGETQAWQGVEPEPIADEENPTLVFFTGQEYEVTWENGDGVGHNFQVLDDGGEVLEETELEDQEGETQSVSFEATEDMVEYQCEPHPDTMNGEIQIEEGDGGGSGNESDEETGGEDNES